MASQAIISKISKNIKNVSEIRPKLGKLCANLIDSEEELLCNEDLIVFGSETIVEVRPRGKESLLV